jgi:hypothetical protein
MLRLQQAKTDMVITVAEHIVGICRYDSRGEVTKADTIYLGAHFSIVTQLRS